ncbi:MAG: hypothetical protein ACI861_000060 [Paracoccaceae bacterium]
MKIVTKIIVALTILFSTTTLTSAKDYGLEVLKMPVGTSAHYVDQSGRRFKWTYKGKFGNKYMIQVSGSERYERFYNADGFLVSQRNQGYTVKYKPHFCNRKLGKCKFRFDSEYSKYTGNWNGDLRKTNGGFQYDFSYASKNTDWDATLFYKFGKYNFFSEYTSGSDWWRLEKITVGK